MRLALRLVFFILRVNPTITKARKDEGMALMSIRVLSHLADALGCSVKDLFDDLPDEATKKDAE